MSTSPNDKGESAPPPDRSTVLLLLGTIGDTTWRMFIPTLGFAAIGLYADKVYGTKPWLSIVGVIAGAIIAGLLVTRQLKKVNK